MSCACRPVLVRRPEPSVSRQENPPKALSLLVALVADSSFGTQQRTVDSMRYIDLTHEKHQARVDWAVVAYDDGATMWGATLAQVSTLKTASLVTVINASADSAQPISKDHRKARWAHQLRLLRAVWKETGATISKTRRREKSRRKKTIWRLHDAIWMPDDDLSFVGFDLASYLRRWLCVFPGGPPIISQPPLHPNAGSIRGGGKQNTELSKPFQNDGATYETCVTGEMADIFGAEDACFLRDTLALRTAFVEGQAALFDANFLFWFVQQPLSQTIARLQLRMAVDAGPDGIWCGAAAEWASKRNLSRPACAVLTVPIYHLDTRSLLGSRSRGHVEATFALLAAAKIRRKLRDSLGDRPLCYRQNCSRHRWFNYQPAPNWKLPDDEEGLRQIRACTVRLEGAAQCHNVNSVHGQRSITDTVARRLGSVAAPDATPCDGMRKLYWSMHEY